MAFDATVLMGALLREHSLNWRLLEHAALEVPFSGFTTEIAGTMFVRNALEGVRGRSFTIEVIWEFLDVFDPLFEPANIRESAIGRALTPNHALHDMPLGKVLYEVTGRTDEALLDDAEKHPLVTAGPSVQHFDPFDLHFIVGALEHGADYLCTSNTTDYTMDEIGRLRIVTPQALAAEFGL